MQDASFSRLDFAFARFLGARSCLHGDARHDFERLVLRLSAAQGRGHSCIHLQQDECELVAGSGCADEAGHLPLVLDRQKLYTRRYWQYEQRLALQIHALCQQNFQFDGLEALLDRYFVALVDEVDWQKEAARAALGQAFCVITGGPGTGKTTTVVKILALLVELYPQKMQIALVAPTGKAAMRLQESIGFSKQSLPCSEVVRQTIPEQVKTIHHLLGAQLPTPRFQHDHQQPLLYDLVVVDEASMVDLALMSKLVDALKPGARLLLLGDKDQLASVESGSVLADLNEGRPGNVYELRKSHRFQGEVKALAKAVNRQRAEEAWQLLQQNGSIGLLPGNPADFVIMRLQAYWEMLDQGAPVQKLLAEFNRFRALCSNRRGRCSVEAINQSVEYWLREQGKIRYSGQWYPGRPVMINQNDAGLKLYNGDIGVCLSDHGTGRLFVSFLCPDGRAKSVLPSRLPQCETAYAMTIHKSQGSEFDEVLLVLAEQLNSVLTKELLYTGITRARQQVKISASEEVFFGAVQHKVERFSGLAAKLISMQYD